MREVTRLMDEDREAALVQLTKLLDETEAATKSVVSSWHTRQCQSLLADIEKDRGNLEGASRIDELAADAAAQEIRELKHASAYMYASAALFRFSLDQNQEAMVLAEKALSLTDTFIDPNEIFERLIREVRRIRGAPRRRTHARTTAEKRGPQRQTVSVRTTKVTVYKEGTRS
jgi:hypothetical protein